MRFAANLNSLWAELPYLDRFDAAARAGFEAVAVPLPYDAPAKETVRATMRSGAPVIHITAPPPNYAGGPRGFAAIPGLEERFRYDMKRALRYCTALKTPVLHVMAGDARGPQARETLISNLRHVAETLPDGLTLTLQPQAQKTAYLCDFALAADIVDAVGSDRLGLQYHSYHAQILQGDAVRVFNTYRSIIRHIQLADAPGEGAPGTGEIDFPGLFARIEATGYGGWVVADYRTEGRTDDSLGWLAPACL